MKEVEFVVAPDDQGITLVDFLTRQLHRESYSRKKIKSLIDKGLCRISGRVVKISTVKVAHKDTIVVLIPDDFFTSRQKIEPVKVLYEDDCILAYDKPFGVVCDDKGLERVTNERNTLFLLHRLDKDTSGVLLFAKNEQVYHKMLQSFKERLVKKRYLAIVDGFVEEKRKSIENSMSCIQKRHGQSLWGVTATGLHAKTDLERITNAKNATLVKLFPLTGRTHQLRVHMSSIGHPILGDTQYGYEFVCTYKPYRQMLHAEMIQFQHPVTQKMIVITSPIPEDMTKAIIALFGEQYTDICAFS